MGFLERIENTRNKPENARRRLAIIWAIIFTALVAFVWLTIIIYGR
ncbi:hypothetical protein ACFLZC_01875 [Patescibacteria group bacterium]